MRTYATLQAAIRDMPSCLVGTTCDEEVGIESQAARYCENPLGILRDLVRVELDVIEEGESDYGPQQEVWIRNYWLRLCGSL